MSIWKCTLHNVEFGSDTKDAFMDKCPVCHRQEMEKLRAEVLKLTDHRDALLRAIEIKQTVEPVSPK